MADFKELMAAKHTQDWYIELYDGSLWYPARENQDFSRFVVGHALSNLCRFTGHTSGYYSVAEHSVKISHLVDRDFAYEALLHDAHECLTNDLSKPVKMFIGGSYEELEEKAEREMRASFGLEPEISAHVKDCDIQMACIEGHHLMHSRGTHWNYYDAHREDALAAARANPYLVPHCWNPDRAKDEWLRRFEELNRYRQED